MTKTLFAYSQCNRGTGSACTPVQAKYSEKQRSDQRSSRESLPSSGVRGAQARLASGFTVALYLEGSRMTGDLAENPFLAHPLAAALTL